MIGGFTSLEYVSVEIKYKNKFEGTNLKNQKY